MVDTRKKLQKILRKTVGAAVFYRGFDYFRSGDVKDMEISVLDAKYRGISSRSVKITGNIKGSKLSNSELVFDLEKEQFHKLSCSCPLKKDCEHSAALGAEFISRFAEFFENRNDKRFFTIKELLDWVNKPKVKAKLGKKFDLAKECHTIINDYHGFAITIRESKPGVDLLKMAEESGGDLTKPQRMLLDRIKQRKLRELSAIKILELIKESGIGAYWEKKSQNNKLEFDSVFPESGEKLQAELFKQKHSSDFVFKLGEKYQASDPFLLVPISGGGIKIENGKIGFVKIPESVSGLVLRAVSFGKYSQHYEIGSGDSRFRTKLVEDEVININRIIADCSNSLDCAKMLAPEFNIRRFNNAEPVLLIDYDSKKNILEAKAAVDYGFKKVDVSHSINRFRRSGRDEFIRVKNAGQKYLTWVNNKDIFYASIKEDLEMRVYKDVYEHWQEYGFKRDITCRIEGEKEIFKFIGKNLPLLAKKFKIECTRDKIDLFEEDFRADINIDLNSEIDLLEFDVECYCGKDKIDLEVLRSYIRNKGKDGFIKLSNGRIWKISNAEELERFIMMLESFHQKEKNKFSGKIYHAPEIEDFMGSQYYQAKTTDSFNKFISEARNEKSVADVNPPEHLKNILRDYQKDGLNWFHFLRKYRFGGILADDMGTGKTLQALALLQMNNNPDKPTIVICPKTLLYNWHNEVEKFAPNLKAVILDGSLAEREEKIKNISKYDLAIASYSVVQRDIELYEKHNLKFDYCILDEAQFVKNHKTKNARAVRRIDADYRLVLTGTPLENSVSEIWAIFDFLMPGFLGNTSHFNEKFQNPIMKESCQRTMRHLRKKISCFMLRRTKGEILKELPPKIEQRNFCQLEASQSILYQEVLANVRSEVFKTVGEKGFAKSQIHILAGLTKLRQICNHPALLLGEEKYTEYESGKLNLFNDLLEEIINSNRRVLVFSQFTKMLDILGRELENSKIGYEYLSGQTKDRLKVVNNFNSGGNPVFLISLKAGGAGLNLTSADNVIIFDPWWNPMAEMQAIDRAHRIGQTQSVNVYRLITKGTIEEKIIKLQEKKKFLFDNLVGESGDLFKKLTWEDVKELFK